MDYWDRVKGEVKRQKTTLEWLATQAGVNYRTFRGWSSLNRLPDVEAGVRIAKALGTTTEWLVTGEGTEPDPWLEDNRLLIDALRDIAPDAIPLVSAMIAAFRSELREASKRGNPTPRDMFKEPDARIPAKNNTVAFTDVTPAEKKGS